MSWTDEQVRQVFREAGTGIGGCPPAETLARALSGDLGREDAEAVVDHLAECADCAEDALSLRTLESWAGRAALEGASPGRRTREIATRRWVSRPLLGITAALLIATIALTVSLLRVRTSQGRETESGWAPRVLANVAIVHLAPAGGSRAAGGAAEAVPAGAPLIVGVLTVAEDTPRYADYAVEVWHGGRLAYRGQGFVRRRDDTFTIALPVDLLARGENRIRLFGLHADRPVPIEEYALRLSGS